MATEITYTADARPIMPEMASFNEEDYQSMLEITPFLFRVHDKRSNVQKNSDGFIAREYIGETPEEIHQTLSTPIIFHSWEEREGVRAHLRHFYKQYISVEGLRCPWISTTPLWTWAVAEAIRRHRIGFEKEIMVSVIDLRALLAGRRSIQHRTVFYGMELLQKTGQTDDVNAPRWTTPSQEILVCGMIPSGAIIQTVPVEKLLLNLPAFFRDENGNFDKWSVTSNDYWYKDPSTGARIRLLGRFQTWATDIERTSGMEMLVHHIASEAFCFALCLVQNEQRTQHAIASAKEKARSLVEEARQAFMHRVEKPAIDEVIARMDALRLNGVASHIPRDFPVDSILQDVRSMSSQTSEMASAISAWGIEDVSNDHWECIQRKIRSLAYLKIVHTVEVEVVAYEAQYMYYRKKCIQNTTETGFPTTVIRA